MVLGAVIGAGVPADAIRAAIDSLGLPITLEVEPVKRCGFAATKTTVHATDEENYRFLPDIEAILAKGSLSDRQRELALAIFRRLAAAEAASHGMPLERVHFHEVGALDSIADVVGAAVGLDLLGVEKFTGSSVPTGGGTVKGAHGIMPVPAPGTAALLTGVPLAKSAVRGELTTPTGAAILVTVVTEFTDAPAMTIERIGTGAGTKDFIEQPNILRMFVGTGNPGRQPGGRHDTPGLAPGVPGESDTVWVLETNLDDCPPEVIGYATDRLFAAGALDVFTTAVQMKKNRPGVLLTVLADTTDRDALEAILFRETATFGVRRYPAERSKLRREPVTVETLWGPVRAKRGGRADGFAVVTPEYEDCARVARENSVPLREVYDAVRATAATRAGPAG
jgi:uncharacterized protein (TIGR00299 family) protein